MMMMIHMYIDWDITAAGTRDVTRDLLRTLQQCCFTIRNCNNRIQSYLDT